ncbi:hypothetical protein QJS66_20670 [Kocuria rhizophila]|nr:hypothetical protein QJS66_20670 [Kocuria rhizophila]
MGELGGQCRPDIAWLNAARPWSRPTGTSPWPAPWACGSTVRASRAWTCVATGSRTTTSSCTSTRIREPWTSFLPAEYGLK